MDISRPSALDNKYETTHSKRNVESIRFVASSCLRKRSLEEDEDTFQPVTGSTGGKSKRRSYKHKKKHKARKTRNKQRK